MKNPDLIQRVTTALVKAEMFDKVWLMRNLKDSRLMIE